MNARPKVPREQKGIAEDVHFNAYTAWTLRIVAYEGKFHALLFKRHDEPMDGYDVGPGDDVAEVIEQFAQRLAQKGDPQ